MIDDFVLIHAARERNWLEDWPDKVNSLKARIKECLSGFPGLGFSHISLVTFSEIDLEKDIWILDCMLDYSERYCDFAPVMYSPSDTPGMIKVEGIGDMPDFDRDPTRSLYVPGMLLPVPKDLNSNALVLRVDVRPKSTGGPGYHYFFRSPRDTRPPKQES